MSTKKIYAESYWGLILPAITAAALVGLLLKRIALDSFSWWGCIFFVVYYAVQHTRREGEAKYGLWSFLLDSAGIGVFFYVTHEVGLFDPTPDLAERPAWLFFWILSIPILGGLSRLFEGRKLRWILSGVIIVSALLGGMAAYLECMTAAAVMMGLLILGLLVYLICNFMEDGGSNNPSCKLCG